MTHISQNNSSFLGWQDLVNDAIISTGYTFNDHVSHYLIITLDRFIDYRHLASDIIAIEYLEGLQVSRSNVGQQQLRQVGDQCLILSGLFPHRAEKLNLPLSYYVDVGQNAYLTIAQHAQHTRLDETLFHQLGHQFTGLMDVLSQIRKN